MENKKVAIITGSSRGIGKAIALKLDKKGFIVVLVSRSYKNLKEALKGFSSNALIIEADVSKEKDVILMFEKVIKKFKRIDVLINNAVFSVFKKIEETDKNDFDKMIGTNIGGLFYCTKEYIKQVKKQSSKGQIINMGSIVSKAPFIFGQRTLYCSMKSAISGFSSALQAEIKGNNGNIKVATIYPGIVFTEWTVSSRNRNYDDLKRNALKTKDIVHIILMILKQGKNSNITEVVVHSFKQVKMESIHKNNK